MVRCDELGVARDAGDPVPSLSAYDQAERRRLDRSEVETYAQVESEAFWDAVDALSDRLGPDATADDAIEAFISDRGLTGAVRGGYARSFVPRLRPMRRTGQTTTRCAGCRLAKSSAARYSAIYPATNIAR